MSDNASPEHQTEIESLRARVAELERSQGILEEHLRDARRLLEAAPVTLYIFDLVEGRNIYANRQITELLGYPAEEVQRGGSEFFTNLVHPADRVEVLPAHFARMARVRDGEAFELTYRMKNARGEWRWLCSIEAVHARGPDGAATQLIGAAYDATERKRLELELQIFKELVARAQNGIALASEDATYAYVNPALCAMSGFHDGLAGLPVTAAMTPEEGSRFQREILPILHKEGAWNGLVEHRRPDGSSWKGRVSAFSLSGSGSQVWLGAILHDVTDELAAEAERSALQAQVIEAQRQALRELATPLIPIADGVIAMPLVGSIDRDRTSQLLEALLGGIVAHRASVAILDITGIKSVNAEVADGLVRAARAARLLGAEVVLTGVGPEVAQTLVGLGAELSGIAVRSTLQSGIAYALRGRSRL
jgi:PAS domain S-box-containing protein